jgi:DNA-binding Lrp family transcriptional regulator
MVRKSSKPGAVKLDLIDRKIIANLDQDSRISETKLAKLVGRSREAVKYRINRLVKLGVITKFLTSINPQKLGRRLFKLFLKLDNVENRREDLKEYFRSHPHTYWMGMCDGAWDASIGVFLSQNHEFFDFKNELVSKFKDIIVDVATSEVVDVRQYNKKYLVKTKPSVVVFGGETEFNKIDKKDQDILALLSNNSRMSLVELSNKVGCSIPTVQKKIKKMENVGIILGYRLEVDVGKIGLEFFKVNIYFKSASKKREKALMEYMLNHPQSDYYIRGIAPWDVEFEFIVDGYGNLNKILNDIRKEFADVIRNHETMTFYWDEWMPSYHKLFS